MFDSMAKEDLLLWLGVAAVAYILVANGAVAIPGLPIKAATSSARYTDVTRLGALRILA